MRYALPPQLWQRVEALLSNRTRRLFLWLLKEQTQEVINGDSNWKIIVNCSGKSLKISLETFEHLAE